MSPFNILAQAERGACQNLDFFPTWPNNQHVTDNSHSGTTGKMNITCTQSAECHIGGMSE